MHNLATSVIRDPKASFDEIYTRNDPREYFSQLGALDYSIPDLGTPILAQIADSWLRRSGRPATILDLGSSYGINAALHRFPLSFATLRERYSRREIYALTTEQLLPLDRRYYQAWPVSRPERMIALDASKPAIDYALSVGLVHDGVAANLEEQRLSADVRARLRDVDIVFSTGCVGYVGAKTFEAILSAARRTPWIVSFVLRMYSYEDIEQLAERAGLATEKLTSAAFMQRRFRDTEEARRVVNLLRARGADPTGLEDEGMLFAELFVSRPADATREEPLAEIVTLASGRNMNLGPRLMHFQRNGRSEIVPAR